MNRTKDNRWIFQKNISSFKKMIEYVEELTTNSNVIEYNTLLRQLNQRENSNMTSESTLGVRMSQLAFYMLGYKSNDKFVPSILTQKYMSGNIEKEVFGLLNLFSMQYPHPFSNTDSLFSVYLGRLILKLLSDNRLSNKLYIDEFIWFLPFIKSIDLDSYNKLVNNILDYREKTYSEKLCMFELIDNYDDVFANVTHEFNYYFLRIFSEMGILILVEDSNHNDGNLFRFKHGDTNTYRTDAYKSRANVSGYVEINSIVYDSTVKLLDIFSLFSPIPTPANSISREYWIKDLYEFNMIDYLSAIESVDTPDIFVQEMIRESRFGDDSGKSFEIAVQKVFDLFEDVKYTELISGSGDTDVLCIFENQDLNELKFNIDTKKSKKGLSQINPSRINKHLEIHNSNYTIIITSRFSKGANKDIKGYKIVNLDVETLGKFVLSFFNNNNFLEYKNINDIIQQNFGSNISKRLEFLTDSLYK